MDAAPNLFSPGRLGYLIFISTVGLGFQPSRIAVLDIVSVLRTEKGLLYNSQRDDLDSR